VKPVLLADENAAKVLSHPKMWHKANDRKFTKYIKPMLAWLTDAPFDDSGWIYEIKWDGYRAVAEISKKGTVRLYSRNGLSFINDYPVVYEALQKLKKDAVLDGEIVALDKEGKPHFQLLQQYAQDGSVPICYYVFDCLYANGKSMEDKPLLERKAILKKLLPVSDVIKYCDHIEGQGSAFFALAKKQGLEGIVAKRADSTYKEGARTKEWLKVKNIFIEEAVIAGYTAPCGGRKYFGALILGLHKNGKLVYTGHTGTGFTDAALKDVYRQLLQLKTDSSPFDTKITVNAPVTWVKPKLVCNLKYAEITAEGQRRHPVFMGLRIDIEAKDVKESPVAEKSKVKRQKPKVV